MTRTCTPAAPDPQPHGKPARPCWEPALSQIRRLSEAETDRLARLWLASLGLRAVGREVAKAGYLAYSGVLGEPPLAVPVAARVYRRRLRLGRRQADEFAGCLARTGHAAGLLVTTGPLDAGSLRPGGLQRPPGVPWISAFSGEEWLWDLAARRIGVGCRLRPVWTVRSPGGDCPGEGARW